jgi:hypothetical protein
MLHISREAADFITKKDCQVHMDNTPGAVEKFNKLKSRKIGLLHITY